jgi:hypothetical protein
MCQSASLVFFRENNMPLSQEPKGLQYNATEAKDIKITRAPLATVKKKKNHQITTNLYNNLPHISSCTCSEVHVTPDVRNISKTGIYSAVLLKQAIISKTRASAS